jgi:hypothetical protein
VFVEAWLSPIHCRAALISIKTAGNGRPERAVLICRMAEPAAGPGVHPPHLDPVEAEMGRGLLLWMIGIPLPIILLIWLFGGLS